MIIREHPTAVDAIVRAGGRQLLDKAEQRWNAHPMTSLHVLQLRRRLRGSRARSVWRPLPPVDLPQKEVHRLRMHFDKADPKSRGEVRLLEVPSALHPVVEGCS